MIKIRWVNVFEESLRGKRTKIEMGGRHHTTKLSLQVGVKGRDEIEIGSGRDVITSMASVNCITLCWWPKLNYLRPNCQGCVHFCH
jgi:hypothetical protein